MVNSPQHYDVIIVGAGLAGSALAAALISSGLDVAIIEAQPLNCDWPVCGDDVDGFDLRVSALTESSRRWLEALGVWSEIAAQRISAYQHMTVWDADGTGRIDFSAGDIREPALGHIVENRLTTTALAKKLQSSRQLDIYSPARLEALQTCDDTEGGHLLRLAGAGGRLLQAPLIVAADGANSWLRREAGLATREWEYGQNAIVATVKTEQGNAATAWQRFLPEGPLAFLPLRTATGDDHFSSIVWSADTAEAERLMALNDSAFRSALGQAFEHRLGAVVAVSRRASFPLRQRHAVDYVCPGIALIGDAAHTIHPLAGQGINLGLLDAQVLSEEILRASKRSLNVGHLSVLQRYQRRRKADNLAMMATMEGFKRLFAARALPVRWARNAGTRWLDRQLPLKRRLVRAAMGLTAGNHPLT